jgi:PKHD-type hydroxylase
MLEQSEHPPRDLNNFLDRPTFAVGYFSAEECLQIRELSASLPTMEGGITDKGTQSHDIRRSTIRWMAPSTSCQWIYQKLWSAVEEVNQCFQFDIYDIREVQIARYIPGDFYDWHLDIGRNKTSTRKLSLSVQLSDPSSYEGGELVLRDFDDEEPVKEIGTVFVFPSYISHRVNRILTGERWSLVAWVHGPPFR